MWSTEDTEDTDVEKIRIWSTEHTEHTDVERTRIWSTEDTEHTDVERTRTWKKWKGVWLTVACGLAMGRVSRETFGAVVRAFRVFRVFRGLVCSVDSCVPWTRVFRGRGTQVAQPQ